MRSLPEVDEHEHHVRAQPRDQEDGQEGGACDLVGAAQQRGEHKGHWDGQDGKEPQHQKLRIGIWTPFLCSMRLCGGLSPGKPTARRN